MGISRVDLQVPFAEKDDAKRLGARWDGRQRTWYVPEGTDPTPFRKWLPESQGPNIRAPSWELVIAPRECWRCGERVHGCSPSCCRPGMRPSSRRTMRRVIVGSAANAQCC